MSFLRNIWWNLAYPLTVNRVRLSAALTVICWHLRLGGQLGAFQIHTIWWCHSHLAPLTVTVTVSLAFRNVLNVQSNYDFPNSTGGAFFGNSQSTNKFNGFPDMDNSGQTTSSVGPTIIPSNNSSRLRQRDSLWLPSQDAARGPNQVLLKHDGTEDMDVFFKKFEICIKNFNWNENEALSPLLSDSVQGQANTISSLPFNFEMTYANVKTKLYTFLDQNVMKIIIRNSCKKFLANLVRHFRNFRYVLLI